MTAEHFACRHCGPHIMVDEDGCCATCGVDCTIAPCGGHACANAISGAVAAEREACAKVADSNITHGLCPCPECEASRDTAKMIAAEIRERR